MDYNDYSNQNYDNPISSDGTATISNPFAGAAAFADESTILMRVFKWMALGLGISAVAALGAYKFLGELLWVAYIPLIIIELILVFVFSLRLQKMSANTAKVCFLAYSLIDGLTLSAIFFTYEISSIYITFFVAAAMFGAAALYGKVTKKNLAGMGTYLFMGLIGLIIAGIINIFLKSAMMDFWISLIGIIIFIALTAYDVNKIRQYSTEYGVETSEQVEKVVVHGALTLYLDFINIFLKLLRFLGKRKN